VLDKLVGKDFSAGNGSTSPEVVVLLEQQNKEGRESYTALAELETPPHSIRIKMRIAQKGNALKSGKKII